jgi:hypothetical protein
LPGARTCRPEAEEHGTGRQAQHERWELELRPEQDLAIRSASSDDMPLRPALERRTSQAWDGDPGRRGFLDGSPPLARVLRRKCTIGFRAARTCDDWRVVAAVFEAQLSPQQAEQLAQLMAEARPTRPGGVLTASLTYEEGLACLTAYWKDRETLEGYLATTSVPRGTELMRKVGAEPSFRVVDVLELG